MNDYSRLLGCDLEEKKNKVGFPKLKLKYFVNANIKNGKFTYGEYPKTIVDSKLGSILTKALDADELKSTGRNYYVVDDWSRKEYEYKGKKYINFTSNKKTIWLKVEPINWTIKGEEAVAFDNILPTKMFNCFYKSVTSKRINEIVKKITEERNKKKR